MGEGLNGSTCLRCCSLHRNAALSNTTLPFPVLPCEIILRFPVKIMVHALAAGCHLSYVDFTDTFAVWGHDFSNMCTLVTCFCSISIVQYHDINNEV